jgi:hypothetical protein
VAGSRHLGQNPRSLEERRLVADMLVVKTRELCDPVAEVIFMKANDGALHPLSMAGSAVGCEVQKQLRSVPPLPAGGHHSAADLIDVRSIKSVDQSTQK